MDICGLVHSQTPQFGRGRPSTAVGRAQWWAPEPERLTSHQPEHGHATEGGLENL
jgi:hypothetical protein